MNTLKEDRGAQRLRDLRLAVKSRFQAANVRCDQDDLITCNAMLDLVNASLGSRAVEEAAHVTIPLLEMTLHRRGDERLFGILSVDGALALALEAVHHVGGEAQVSKVAA